jgi:hypothetical protein
VESTGQEVLVTHSFLISDKFAKRRTDEQKLREVGTPPQQQQQEPSNSNKEHNNVRLNSKPTASHGHNKHDFYAKDSSSTFHPDGPVVTKEGEEPFSPEGLEVCLNLTGLIVGVAAFLVIQLVLVFAWSHFWQSRQKKKRNG